MRQMNTQSGFTLLEILVVIIIVGVLASVAMPTLFRNVERARSTEAMNTMGIVKRGLDACSMQFNGNYTTCSTFGAAGMSDPSNGQGNPGSHFNYAIVSPSATGFTVRATRMALDNGNSGDTINLVLNAGIVTRSGNGAFDGIQ
jgi:prepilin-type N-terminal cleavage/methylation domain-containing protein